MHQSLSINLTVTTNQKPTTDTQKLKRKVPKYKSRENQTIMKISKRKNEQKRTQNQSENNF